MEENIPHPPIASEAEWRRARIDLLAKEKELTHAGDRIAADRRRLPMVRLEKAYEFDSPDGKKSLADLFEGRRQLIVYHFMFDPEWDRGCGGCTWYVNALGDLTPLQIRDTTFALISRAPLAKLEAYKCEMGWTIPWYSSFGSDFNYDFHATQDESRGPIEYNYMDKAALVARRGSVEAVQGEDHGLSVFFRMGDNVFHTYSSYARGVERLTDSNALLDVTPYGRQEDFEDSPEGWPQRPTYG